MSERITRRNMLKFAATAGVAVGAAPLLAACQAAAPVTARVTAPPGMKSIIWGTTDNGFTKLDPQFTLDGFVNYSVFEKLTFVSADGSFGKDLGLATEWRAVDDKRWQFKLRQGVKFQNGDPFTAADVKFTFERALDPAKKTLIAASLAPMTGVEIVDDYTVNIVTNKVDPLMPRRLSFYGGSIIPKKYVTEEGDAGFEAKPVGTGPFRLTRFTRDEQTVMEAHKTYWNGAPNIDGITVRVIPEESSRMTALLDTHEINFINNVPIDRLAQVRSNPFTKSSRWTTTVS